MIFYLSSLAKAFILTHFIFRERALQQNMVSCMSVSTQTVADDQAGKLWDELSLVGLPDAIDVQALFDSAGKGISSLTIAS